MAAAVVAAAVDASGAVAVYIHSNPRRSHVLLQRRLGVQGHLARSKNPSPVFLPSPLLLLILLSLPFLLLLLVSVRLWLIRFSGPFHDAAPP